MKKTMKTSLLYFTLSMLFFTGIYSCKKHESTEPEPSLLGTWIYDTTGQSGVWDSKLVIQDSIFYQFDLKRSDGSYTYLDTGYWILSADTCFYNRIYNETYCGKNLQLMMKRKYGKSVVRITRDTLYMNSYCCLTNSKYYREK